MFVKKVARELKLLCREANPLVLGARAARYWEMYQTLRRYVETHIGDLRDKRILDFGSGIRYPMTRCLTVDSAKAVGLDPKHGSDHFRSGRERFKQQLWSPLVHERFAKSLAYASGHFRLAEQRVFLVAGTGIELPFADNCFDAVVSFSVLEHVDDLKAVAKELARVTVPGGINVHQIHLYTSMSGCHTVQYDLTGRPIFGEAGPWGHLKGSRPAPSLNRLRESKFHELLEEHFDVVAWDLERLEGIEWMTAELEAELAAFSRDELFRRSIFAVLRPKKPSDARPSQHVPSDESLESWLPLLECPRTRTPLSLSNQQLHSEEIPQLSYPILNGVPHLLP